MTDPVYSYVKGKGWIPYGSNTVTLACGTVVRIERRNPRIQERYYYRYPDAADSEWFTNTVTKFLDFNMRINHDPRGYPERVYFTLVPVDD